MVGTFYAAPKPGEKPFVSVGASINEDTDVCIIEAMKTFNNIKAECRGTIVRILVQDGHPVEFGTVLFLVKPS
jgi:acetyl-CoA carboxylase biotin carboxyl carrier protein